MGLFDNWKEKLDEKIYRGDFDWVADICEKAEEELDILDRRVRRKIDKTFDPIIETADKVDALLGLGDHKYDTFEERLGKIFSSKKEEERYWAEYGDIIGVNRGIYEHYGIYIGGDRVIHYTSYTDNIQDNVIMETDMSNFLRGSSSYFVFDCENQGRDKIVAFSNGAAIGGTIGASLFEKEVLVIYSPEETVERAKSRLGENKYSLPTNNCEHFAIWCKTGISKSYQVDRFLGKGSRNMIRL